MPRTAASRSYLAIAGGLGLLRAVGIPDGQVAGERHVGAAMSAHFVMDSRRPLDGLILMVAEDGGIFAFGDAAFRGSLGAQPPPIPIVAVAALP